MDFYVGEEGNQPLDLGSGLVLVREVFAADDQALLEESKLDGLFIPASQQFLEGLKQHDVAALYLGIGRGIKPNRPQGGVETDGEVKKQLASVRRYRLQGFGHNGSLFRAQVEGVLHRWQED